MGVIQRIAAAVLHINRCQTAAAADVMYFPSTAINAVDTDGGRRYKHVLKKKHQTKRNQSSVIFAKNHDRHILFYRNCLKITTFLFFTKKFLTLTINHFYRLFRATALAMTLNS